MSGHGDGSGANGSGSNSSGANGSGAGNGLAVESGMPGGAEVLRLPRRRGTRSARTAQARVRRGSPPDDLPPGPPAPSASGAPTLESRVCALAAKGLDEEEIRARLELPPALDGEMEQVLGDAFRRGQLLGRARIKEALFEAAVQGRVTAQVQVLRRLGQPAGEDGQDVEPGAAGDDPGAAPALAGPAPRAHGD